MAEETMHGGNAAQSKWKKIQQQNDAIVKERFAQYPQLIESYDKTMVTVQAIMFDDAPYQGGEEGESGSGFEEFSDTVQRIAQSDNMVDALADATAGILRYTLEASQGQAMPGALTAAIGPVIAIYLEFVEASGVQIPEEVPAMAWEKSAVVVMHMLGAGPDVIEQLMQQRQSGTLEQEQMAAEQQVQQQEKQQPQMMQPGMTPPPPQPGMM